MINASQDAYRTVYCTFSWLISWLIPILAKHIKTLDQTIHRHQSIWTGTLTSPPDLPGPLPRLDFREFLSSLNQGKACKQIKQKRNAKECEEQRTSKDQCSLVQWWIVSKSPQASQPDCSNVRWMPPVELIVLDGQTAVESRNISQW